RQHIGLLSREVGVRVPPAPLAPSSTVERSPYKGATRGSTPPAPNGEVDRGDRRMTTRSSRAEHSADNRKTKVRLLPGRLPRRSIRWTGTKALVAERLALNQVGEGSSPSGPTRDGIGTGGLAAKTPHP